MEVLRHGNTYKQIRCNKCGALLSYCKSDIEFKSFWNYYDSEKHKHSIEYIKCLECKNRITLKSFVDGKEQKL